MITPLDVHKNVTEAAEQWTTAERSQIMNVMLRDIAFQRENSSGLQKLRSELNELQSQKAIPRPVATKEPAAPKHAASERTCCMCHIPVKQFRSSFVCKACNDYVCPQENCFAITPSGHAYCMCCYKLRQWLCASGEWFYTSATLRDPGTSTLLDECKEYYPGGQLLVQQPITMSYTLLAELQKATHKPFGIDTTGMPTEIRSSRFTPKEKSRSKTKRFQSSTKKHESLQSQKSISNENISSHSASTEPMLQRTKSIEVITLDSHLDSPEVTINMLEATPPQRGSLGNLFVFKKQRTQSERDLTAIARHSANLEYGKSALDVSVPELSKTHGVVQSVGRLAPLHRSVSKEDELQKGDMDVDLDTLSVNSMGHSMSRSSRSLTAVSSESIVSGYSGAGVEAYLDDVSGEIQLQLHYNCKTATLEVFIVQCKDLKSADSKKTTANPYVKTYLLPDRSVQGKRKTRPVRNTLNPNFGEVLRYSPLLKTEIEKRNLLISVWHSDRLGRNVHLGEVILRLGEYPWYCTVPTWYILSPKQQDVDIPSEQETLKGELCFSVKFVPPDRAAGKESQLHILLRCGRNLRSVRLNGSANSFVKAVLTTANKTKKLKSPVIKKDLNPVWNFTFVFDSITSLMLREGNVELTVWDFSRLKTKEFLGGLRLNLGLRVSDKVKRDWTNANQSEARVWASMLDKPNCWAEACLPLRANMMEP